MDNKLTKFMPKLMTNDMNFEMQYSVVTGGDGKTIVAEGNFRSNTDYGGMYWETEDKQSHPLFRYPTDTDLSKVKLVYDFKIEGDMPSLEDVIGQTMTVNMIDGSVRHIRLWNYVIDRPLQQYEKDTGITFPAGRPTDGTSDGFTGRVEIDFGNLYAGWAPFTFEFVEGGESEGQWVETPDWEKVDTTKIKNVHWGFTSKSYPLSLDPNNVIHKPGITKSGTVNYFYMLDKEKVLYDVENLYLNAVTVPILINTPRGTSSDMSLDETKKQQAIELIDYLKARKPSLKILLKPVVLVDAGGDESTWNPSDFPTWAANYKAVMNTIIEDIANPKKVDTLFVGTRFRYIEHNQEFWVDLIREVKQKFSGRVSYIINHWITATWDEEFTAKYQATLNNPMFGELDFISIAAYFELTEKENPTIADLRQYLLSVDKYSRGQNVYNEIKAFNDKWKKPIFFGELGAVNLLFSASNPSDSTISTTISENSQANILAAYKDMFEDASWVNGVSLYQIGSETTHFSIKDKTVSAGTVKNWYVINSIPHEPLDDSTWFRCVFTNWEATGDVYLRDIPDPLPAHLYRVADDYDDNYNITPEWLVEQLYRLGFREWINFYIGASHFYDKRGKKDANGEFMKDESGNYIYEMITTHPFNDGFLAWYKAYLHWAKGYGVNKIVQSVSMENVNAPEDWWQRTWDGRPGMTLWTPPPKLLSFTNKDVQAFYKMYTKGLVEIALEAKLEPVIQLGEPWWWFVEVEDTQPPCFYDAATRQKHKEDLGYDMPIFKSTKDDFTGHEATLDWLRKQNGEFAHILRDWLQERYPNCKFTILFFPPSVLDADRVTPMMAKVNFPKPEWRKDGEGRELDFFQIEDYDYLIAGDWDKNEEIYDFTLKQLGYQHSQTQYFVGFSLAWEEAMRLFVPQLIPWMPKDEYYKYIWGNINKALVKGVSHGMETYIWASAQIRKDGWIPPEMTWICHSADTGTIDFKGGES